MNVKNSKTFSSDSSQGSGKKQKQNLKNTMSEEKQEEIDENSMKMTEINIQKNPSRFEKQGLSKSKKID